MKFEDFWYVVAESSQLKTQSLLKRQVLGEWLAIFRGADGQAVALQDRCLHRQGRLSTGSVQQGCLRCPYHGWTYDASGQVIAVPAEGQSLRAGHQRRIQTYPTREQDGYVYVCLNRETQEEITPFPMPFYREPGWQSVRLINLFHNSVTNCAENFIDIPHTVWVHPGVFRNNRQQELKMQVSRQNGSVQVEYLQETDNLGWYQRFLNPTGAEIKHYDAFHMPNVTCVEYQMGPQRRLFITSQSVPETETSTLVYTDVTFNYGLWNWICSPFIRWTAQHIINQDIQVLNQQQQVIDRYGQQFHHTPADTIHVFVESIRDALRQGKDPRHLPDQSVSVSFWV
jgi:phenylpropionate dioxygenase-like ring-hydroxylating dioxygenase large terminal subunit